jgi:hypothetical protein
MFTQTDCRGTPAVEQLGSGVREHGKNDVNLARGQKIKSVVMYGANGHDVYGGGLWCALEVYTSKECKGKKVAVMRGNGRGQPSWLRKTEVKQQVASWCYACEKLPLFV